jgi:hypothetical protein
MIRRDYLMRQVEDFAKVMGKILGLKSKGEYSKANEVISVAYNDLLNISDQVLNETRAEDLVEELTNKHHLQKEQINIIAELLFHEGEIAELESRLDESHEIYLKSLSLFEHLNKEETTYNIERIGRIKTLISKLSIDSL